MNGKVMMRTLLVALLFAGYAGTNLAQDINKATEAFNKALELQSTDPKGAIASVKSCLEVCDQIGEDADDLKMRAEMKLPELYYNVGNSYVKDKKIMEAIPAYKEAIKVAQQYKVTEVEKKATNMLPQLYYAVGGVHYKKDEFDETIAAMQQAIDVDPTYAKAYYTIGLVYKKQNNLTDFETIMDKGLVAAEKSRDNNYKNRISKSASSAFLEEGAAAVTGGKSGDAVPMLKKSLKYDAENSDVFFYLATAHNELKEWDLAIEAANNGLKFEKDEDDKKAKHYFNLGMAYKGKGDKNAACAAFNNALFGQFKDNAQYEIDNTLKCKE